MRQFVSAFLFLISFLPFSYTYAETFYSPPVFSSLNADLYALSIQFDKEKHSPASTLPLSSLVVSGGIYQKQGSIRGPLIVSLSEKKVDATSGIWEQTVPSSKVSPNTEYFLSLLIKGKDSSGKEVAETVPDSVISTSKQNEVGKGKSATVNDPDTYTLLAPIS